MASQINTQTGSHQWLPETITIMAEPADNKLRHIEVTAADLPLHCPTSAMLLWNAHPRVFMDVAKTGEALCPYCGTKYTLKGGAGKAGH